MIDPLDKIHSSLEKPPIPLSVQLQKEKEESFAQKKKWARRMRKNPTKAESVLWKAIQHIVNKKRFKARNQYVIHGFIADIAFLKQRIVIEVDGSSHKNRKEYDKNRDVILKKYGWRTYRFTNNEVIKKTAYVVSKIEKLIKLPVPQLQVNRVDKLEAKFRETGSHYHYKLWMDARKNV
jgi:very-short-patch-repair endonuclease